MGKKKKVLSIQKNILQVLDQTPNQTFNYKQIAAKLGVNDASSRNHIQQKVLDICHFNLGRRSQSSQGAVNVTICR